MSNRDEKVGRFLEGGLEVFLRFGYRKTTLDDVARACGVSRATIYKYFPNKEALVRAFVAAYLQGMRAAQAAAVDPAAPPEERLVAVVGALWRNLRPIRDRFGGGLSQAKEVVVVCADQMEAWNVEMRSFIQGLVEEGVATGRYRPVDAALLAVAIHGALRGLLEGWIFEPEQTTNLEAAELLVRTLFDGLRSGGTA